MAAAAASYQQAYWDGSGGRVVGCADGAFRPFHREFSGDMGIRRGWQQRQPGPLAAQAVAAARAPRRSVCSPAPTATSRATRASRLLKAAIVKRRASDQAEVVRWAARGLLGLRAQRAAPRGVPSGTPHVCLRMLQG